MSKNDIALLDFSNIAYANVYVAFSKDPLDVNFDYWKFLTTRTILKYVTMFNKQKFIIALDGKENWRKDVYSDYKGQRSAAKAESPIDWNKFFEVMEKFIEELADVFPTLILMKTPNAEADDIIATLTKQKSSEGSKVTIISRDKDFHQLQRYPGVTQYDPVKNVIVEVLNPKNDLLVKIMVGDKSDNIPQIFPRVGPTTAAKIITSGIEDYLEEKGDLVREAFDRNKHLIDMTMIPKTIQSSVLEQYNEMAEVAQKATSKGRKVYKFFMGNGMPTMLTTYAKVEPLMESLNK